MTQAPPFGKHAFQLINMGRHREALMVCDKWISAQPNNPQSWYAKAFCESHMGKQAESLRSIKKALALNPDEPQILVLYAKTLATTGSVQQGIDICEALFDNTKCGPYILDRIAEVYLHASYYDKAHTTINRAIELEPNEARFYGNLANILTFNDRAEEAKQAYEKVIELEPDNFIAYNQLAKLESATKENNHIQLCQSALQKHPDNVMARTVLNYALAKQHEDIKDYDQAFKHLDAGAQAALEHTPYNSEQALAQFDLLIEGLPPEVFEKNIEGFDSAEPIFIIGMPRSGTTLVEQIIDTNDDVFAAGELKFFSMLFRQHLNHVATNRRNPFLDADKINFKQLGKDYINSTRPQTGHCRHFIDKLPLNYITAGPIGLALPKAKFINLKRNPMDTCFSNYKLLFQPGTAMYSYSQKDLAHNYAHYQKLMDHWHKCMPGRILDVCYENLTENPEQESKRIFEFLELPWSPECLEFYKSKKAVSTASTRQVRNPIYRSSVEKWRYFETHLKPMQDELIKLGVEC